MGGVDIKAHKLYLRLPEKIVDEKQILDLHPQISVVVLPRQKSRRWCIVEFKDKSQLEKVRSALKKIKIKGKSIIIKEFRIPNKKKSQNQQEDLSVLLS